MYNKIFTKILDSSIWLESVETRIVWLTMIAAMDEDGFVEFAAPGNVASRARVPLDKAEAAIKLLESEDTHAPHQDYGGRRIERVPGGWVVLNAQKYHDIVTRLASKEQNRERVRRFREKNRVTSEDIDAIIAAGADAWKRRFPHAPWHFDGLFRSKMPNLTKPDLEPFAGELVAHIDGLKDTKYFNPEKWFSVWRANLDPKDAA